MEARDPVMRVVVVHIGRDSKAPRLIIPKKDPKEESESFILGGLESYDGVVIMRREEC